MFVKKEKLEALANWLNEVVEYMDETGKSSVRTEENTYFCSCNFISFGSIGFLDIKENWMEDLEFKEDKRK